MEENEYWAVHQFYAELAQYKNIDLEDQESYTEHGTYPSHVHKEAEEHKESIRIISTLLEEETNLPITGLETWRDDYKDHAKYHKRDPSTWDNPIGK